MNHLNRMRDLNRWLILLWLSLVFSCPATAEDDYSAELPRIPPTDPADALETFTVAPGFRIELVAAEPLVSSPVAIEWDAAGRLYVCEMRGYSEDKDLGIANGMNQTVMWIGIILGIQSMLAFAGVDPSPDRLKATFAFGGVVAAIGYLAPLLATPGGARR